ncbi:MAG TPA: hypothetical protein VF484_02760 [Candidatus Limnocylindrales bacterium]
MRRDLDPIELPPPMPDYGRATGDDVIDDADQAGNQPIDNLDLGTDPERLGAPGGGIGFEDDRGRPGIEERGPVQEPPARDDPEAMARSHEAKAATASTLAAGEADPSATRTEGMPTDAKARPVDRDPSA